MELKFNTTNKLKHYAVCLAENGIVFYGITAKPDIFIKKNYPITDCNIELTKELITIKKENLLDFYEQLEKLPCFEFEGNKYNFIDATNAYLKVKELVIKAFDKFNVIWCL